jgi:hypothetical protein
MRPSRSPRHCCTVLVVLVVTMSACARERIPSDGHAVFNSVVRRARANAVGVLHDGPIPHTGPNLRPGEKFYEFADHQTTDLLAGLDYPPWVTPLDRSDDSIGGSGICPAQECTEQRKPQECLVTSDLVEPKRLSWYRDDHAFGAGHQVRVVTVFCTSDPQLVGKPKGPRQTGAG